ncbi:hypothetical protein Pcinc_033242 [Petrolisthes cinctipes]|uniref:Uncharacterized protein n=1 Tax=Petrolisthes cinctipes TaxID=88211 RepID=A0AAE1K1S1_PETCI|nr:hypothetical protein Pcinc_033242 [Petrolisthes cinctipes]
MEQDPRAPTADDPPDFPMELESSIEDPALQNTDLQPEDGHKPKRHPKLQARVQEGPGRGGPAWSGPRRVGGGVSVVPKVAVTRKRLPATSPL